MRSLSASSKTGSVTEVAVTQNADILSYPPWDYEAVSDVDNASPCTDTRLTLLLSLSLSLFVAVEKTIVSKNATSNATVSFLSFNKDKNNYF